MIVFPTPAATAAGVVFQRRKMRIYTAKTYELQTAEEERLCVLLDSDRLQKVTAIRSSKERARSIFAGLLLRYAFFQAGYGAEVWEQVVFEKELYGKPYLKGYPEFHFSLSHSGEWVVCVADKTPVGVDIQEMKPWKMSLAKRFYHEDEYNRLLELGGDQTRQTEEFYSMWTAKESAVKLSGRGIGAGISQYVTAVDYSDIYDIYSSQTFCTRRYQNIKGYMLCVCSRTKFFPESSERIYLENVVMEGNRC